LFSKVPHPRAFRPDGLQARDLSRLTGEVAIPRAARPVGERVRDLIKNSLPVAAVQLKAGAHVWPGRGLGCGCAAQKKKGIHETRHRLEASGAQLASLQGAEKKTFPGYRQMLAFRTLGKRWPLSLTSLPPGETRVREQAAEIPVFLQPAKRANQKTQRPLPPCGGSGRC
jgi:hypothetical protein